MSFGKNRLLLVGLVVLLVGIPLVVTLLQRQQENRSQAAKSTTLSFIPQSTTAAPIQKNVNDTVSLDLMVNPGSNLVSIIRLEVTYDQTKLEPASSNPFQVNGAVFPTTIEGPVLNVPGKILVAMSIGGDPTKAVQTTAKAATINFRAIAGTSTPTLVGIGSLTQVFSIAANDQANENVLASSTPAAIAITGGGGVTPTITQTQSPTPTIQNNTPTPTQPVATNTPAPTSTPVPNGARIDITMFLHGVGNSGDNPNPNQHSLSNKTPVNPQRNVNVLVYNSANELIANSIGTVNYSSPSGNFTGVIDLGDDIINGDYNIKVKTDKYLRRLSGIHRIVRNLVTEIPPMTLVAGDVNDDNRLDILDYNILLDCGYGVIEALPMTDPNSAFAAEDCQSHEERANADVNDTGVVDSRDYNLFIRELSVQNGE